MSFKEDLKVSMNSFNPNVFTGVNLIPYILIYLGVKEKIARNPIVRLEIADIILKIVDSPKRARMSEVIDRYASVTQEDIRDIINTITRSMEKAKQIENGETEESDSEYIGIEVDNEGNILTKSVNTASPINLSGKYELDENGNLVATEWIHHTVDENSQAGKIIQTYNEYGIQMKSEDYSNLSIDSDGNEYGKYVIMERLEENPFIGVKTYVNIGKPNYLSKREQSYTILFPSIEQQDPDSRLEDYANEKRTEIHFKTKEGAIAYFNNYDTKKKFLQELSANKRNTCKCKPKNTYFNTRNLGLIILAKNSGVKIGDEQIDQK